MNTQAVEENKELSLSARLEMRALAEPKNKAKPTISKIIEARAVLSKQRMQGHSWADLAGFLSQEGVHIAEGTLRNYMGMIGTAVDALSATSQGEVSDEQIHRNVSAQMTKAARDRAAKKRAASKPRMPIPGGQPFMLPPSGAKF